MKESAELAKLIKAAKGGIFNGTGDASAQYQLGLMYARGEKGAQNIIKGFKWLKRAAFKGHVRAQSSCGVMCGMGLGVEKDDAKAFEWYQMAATNGDATAQYNLGRAWAEGLGVQRDYVRAVEWYKKAAKQEQATAQFCLGWAYANGQGVEKDEPEALFWYEKSAANGDKDAIEAVKELQTKDIQKKEVKPASPSIKNIQPAQQTPTTTQNVSSDWLLDDDEPPFQGNTSQGTNTPPANQTTSQNNTDTPRQDIKEQLEQDEKLGDDRDKYNKAGEISGIDEQYNIGYMYEYGVGVEKDETKAFEWYQKVAILGHAKAQQNLGYMYENGQGVIKDEVEALFWYEKSAANGIEYAIKKVKEFKAKGIEKNRAKPLTPELLTIIRPTQQISSASPKASSSLSSTPGQESNHRKNSNSKDDAKERTENTYRDDLIVYSGEKIKPAIESQVLQSKVSLLSIQQAEMAAVKNRLKMQTTIKTEVSEADSKVTMPSYKSLYPSVSLVSSNAERGDYRTQNGRDVEKSEALGRYQKTAVQGGQVTGKVKELQTKPLIPAILAIAQPTSSVSQDDLIIYSGKKLKRQLESQVLQSKMVAAKNRLKMQATKTPKVSEADSKVTILPYNPFSTSFSLVNSSTERGDYWTQSGRGVAKSEILGRYQKTAAQGGQATGKVKELQAKPLPALPAIAQPISSASQKASLSLSSTGQESSSRNPSNNKTKQETKVEAETSHKGDLRVQPKTEIKKTTESQYKEELLELDTETLNALKELSKRKDELLISLQSPPRVSSQNLEQYNQKLLKLQATISTMSDVMDEEALSVLKGQTQKLQALISKETLAQHAELERQHIFQNGNLSDYYYTFMQQLRGLWMACQSIHSGKVANDEQTKLDTFATILDTIGQCIAIPGASLITGKIKLLISLYTNRDKKLAVNNLVNFFGSIIETDTLIETLSRQLTLTQERTLQKLATQKYGTFQNFLQTLKDAKNYLASDDVDTLIKECAAEQCKNLVAAILKRKLKPHPKLEDLDTLLSIILEQSDFHYQSPLLLQYSITPVSDTYTASSIQSSVKLTNNSTVANVHLDATSSQRSLTHSYTKIQETEVLKNKLAKLEAQLAQSEQEKKQQADKEELDRHKAQYEQDRKRQIEQDEQRDTMLAKLQAQFAHSEQERKIQADKLAQMEREKHELVRQQQEHTEKLARAEQALQKLKPHLEDNNVMGDNSAQMLVSASFSHTTRNNLGIETFTLEKDETLRILASDMVAVKDRLKMKAKKTTEVSGGNSKVTREALFSKQEKVKIHSDNSLSTSSSLVSSRNTTMLFRMKSLETSGTKNLQPNSLILSSANNKPSERAHEPETRKNKLSGVGGSSQ